MFRTVDHDKCTPPLLDTASRSFFLSSSAACSRVIFLTVVTGRGPAALAGGDFNPAHELRREA